MASVLCITRARFWLGVCPRTSADPRNLEEQDPVFGNLGAGEILLIVVFILIFFGPKKIPEIAQGLGKGIREFRKATREIQDVVEREVNQVKETGPIPEVKEIKEIAQAIVKGPDTPGRS